MHYRSKDGGPACDNPVLLDVAGQKTDADKMVLVMVRLKLYLCVELVATAVRFTNVGMLLVRLGCILATHTSLMRDPTQDPWC